ncbi:sulfite oxidase heme-binding subunit YedZ [Alteromonas gracilis]|uniref:sulfite oxidase heme-binding subunit YedZ n=1 Tax=Alteromonas gracilis TaxID=1479524 RepID=UPI0030D3F1D2
MEHWLRFFSKSHAFLSNSIYLVAMLLSVYLCMVYFSSANNVYQLLMKLTGQYALIYLVIVLTITPLRRWAVIACQQCKLSYGKRLSDWNWLIKLRRSLGMVCTFFALVHLYFYLWLDFDWLWQDIVWDANTRPFIALGWISIGLLCLLALTSPDVIQKVLKRRWRQIHRCIYLLAIVVLYHFGMSEKAGSNDVTSWAIIVAILLLHRVWFGLLKSSKNAADDGMLAQRAKSNRRAKHHVKKSI